MNLSRRSFLGAAAVGLAAPLALSACGPFDDVKGPKVGTLQLVDSKAPNGERDGFIQGLARHGFIEGRNLNVVSKDAAGELGFTTLVVEQFLAQGVDLIFAIGTPTLQAAIRKCPSDFPIISAWASNPFGAGAGTFPGGVGQHLPNVVGTIGTNPVGKELELAQALSGGGTRFGLIFNPGESNSRYEAGLMRDAAKQQGVELVERSVASSNDVLQAAQSLAGENIDAFVKIGDYATIQGFGAIGKVGLENRIPVVSVDADDIYLPGCLATIGWSYEDEGRQAGGIAARVLKGTSPATLAWEVPDVAVTQINLQTAQAIGVTVPPKVVAAAATIVR